MDLHVGWFPWGSTWGEHGLVYSVSWNIQQHFLTGYGLHLLVFLSLPFFTGYSITRYAVYLLVYRMAKHGIVTIRAFTCILYSYFLTYLIDSILYY